MSRLLLAAFEYSKPSGHDARIDESGMLQSTASDWFHLRAAVGVDCALPLAFWALEVEIRLENHNLLCTWSLSCSRPTRLKVRFVQKPSITFPAS